jgi:hypothetical protein
MDTKGTYTGLSRRRTDNAANEDPSATTYDHEADADYVQRNTRLQWGLGVLLAACLGWAISMTAVYANSTSATDGMNYTTYQDRILAYAEAKKLITLERDVYKLQLDLSETCYNPTELLMGDYMWKKENLERVMFRVIKAQKVINPFPGGQILPRQNRHAVTGALDVQTATFLKVLTLHTSSGDWTLKNVFISDVDYNYSVFNHDKYDYFSVAGPSVATVLNALHHSEGMWLPVQGQVTYPKLCYTKRQKTSASMVRSPISYAKSSTTFAELTEGSNSWNRDFTTCYRLFYNGVKTSWYRFVDVTGEISIINSKGIRVAGTPGQQIYVNDYAGEFQTTVPTDQKLTFDAKYVNQEALLSTWTKHFETDTSTKAATISAHNGKVDGNIEETVGLSVGSSLLTAGIIGVGNAIVGSVAAAGGTGAVVAATSTALVTGGTDAAFVVLGTVAAVCFPGHATVDCESGSIRMEDLRVGDRCRDGTGEFQTIYMISHAEATLTAAYIRLRTETNHTLELTAGHYLPVGGLPMRAERVRVGDVVETTDGKTSVKSIEHVNLVGTFNPFTTSGSLIVNGVHALCASDTFLDAYLPESAIPATWQVLLAPVRWIQWIAPHKMKRFHKDVNGMEMGGNIGRALASFVAA